MGTAFCRHAILFLSRFEPGKIWDFDRSETAGRNRVVPAADREDGRAGGEFPARNDGPFGARICCRIATESAAGLLLDFGIWAGRSVTRSGGDGFDCGVLQWIHEHYGNGG